LFRLADAFHPAEIAFDAIAPFQWGIRDLRAVESWHERLEVREVATLPTIARRFPHRVRLAHRIAGSVVERMLPRFARGYQLCRMITA
jgi:hypothetical protein